VLKLEKDAYFTTISISDNGCGFPPDIREKVLAASAPDSAQSQKISGSGENGSTGTGLINVISRLRLYFHRGDVFDILANSEGQGTKFLIRIPNV
jgi:two-component system, sensor histidine kinase YesM